MPIRSPNGTTVQRRAASESELPVCDPSGARATAAAIPGAELVLIEGMGHNLPPGLWDRTADRIAAIVQKGEARRR